VRAPIAGRVVARSVEPGQTVAQGTPLFTIADLSRRRVEAEVDESDIAHLRVGAPEAITAEGYRDSTWTGHVTSIPEQVVPRRLRPEDPARPSDTRVLLVRVAIPTAAPFKLGQRVELRISVPRSRAP
jgi:multidrug resistance efflux pump